MSNVVVAILAATTVLISSADILNAVAVVSRVIRMDGIALGSGATCCAFFVCAQEIAVQTINRVSGTVRFININWVK